MVMFLSSIQPMTNDELTGFSIRWLGVTTDVKRGADLVLSVGGRMFGARAMDAAADAPPGFKVPQDRLPGLTAQPGFVPAPHLARAGWVGAPAGVVRDANLRAMVRTSCGRVRARLSKKLQHALAD